MSKLGEILRELKQGSEQEVKKSQAKTYNYRRVLILFGLGLLFIGSIVGGFYVVKVVEGFKNKPRYEVATPSPILEQRPLTQPEVIKSAENQTTPTEQKMPNVKTLTQISSSKRENQTDNKLISTSKTNPEKIPIKKAMTKTPPQIYTEKKETKEKVGASPVEHIHVKDSMPPLREKGLLENLLLNAEEARKKGSYEEASRFYMEYLKYKKDPDVLNNLGNIYLLLGNYKKAEETYSQALSIKYDVVYELNYFLSLIMQQKKDTACELIHHKKYPQQFKEYVEFLKNLCN